jgi:rSAM/selenodomain-associated transferase 2
MAGSDVSVIIPVYRDATALDALLTRLGTASPAPGQIIVVNADPGIRPICREGVRVVAASANRGAQLDAGARAATGRVLWFLHADAAPAAGAVAAIIAAVEGGAESGCFRFEFTGQRRWWMPMLERMIALRIAAGGMVYGDQGIFTTRAAYAAAGGFIHAPLFEEVGLVRALRARGTFVRLPLALGVSPRRWERDGWWRRSLHNRWLALCYMSGVSVPELARRYRRATGARGGTEQ